jgi:hypothetical protein
LVAAPQRSLETTLNPPVIGAERRRDLELRVVFDEVYARVEPFFDPTKTWGGSALTMLVYRIVRESYPHLDAMQVHVLVAAMQRVQLRQHAHGARPPARAAEATEPA